jgi:arylamine N-acetyltransferase
MHRRGPVNVCLPWSGAATNIFDALLDRARGRVADVPKLSRATSIFVDLYGLKPARPGLSQLGEIALQFASLPWENLTKLIRKHEPREAEALEQPLPERIRNVPGAGRLRLSAEVLEDHAAFGAGGTCFSLTNALRRITTDLGYRVWPAMADMRHGANVHCALVVELDGKRFLLDPGYLVAEPVPLRPGRTARLGFPGHALEYRGSGRGDSGGDAVELHTVNDRGEDLFRYRLRPDAVSDADFVRFWVESFDATGMNGLHLNRFTSEGRLSAHDLNLRIDNGRDKVNVKLRDGYVDQVSDRFGIDPGLVRRAFGQWERIRCRRG